MRSRLYVLELAANDQVSKGVRTYVPVSVFNHLMDKCAITDPMLDSFNLADEALQEWLPKLKEDLDAISS